MVLKVCLGLGEKFSGSVLGMEFAATLPTKLEQALLLCPPFLAPKTN